MYINGKKELSVTDTALASGRIALHTNNAAVLFDDVVVQNLPSAAVVSFSDTFESGSAAD